MKRTLLCMLAAVMLNAQSVQYTYDSLNRLVKAAYSGGAVITYTYDATGNRTSQVITNPAIPLSTITLDKTLLTFNASLGQGDPTPQTITVSNGGGGTLNWLANAADPWVKVNPTLGTNSGSITVSPSILGLSAGTLNSVVLISSPDSANTPQSIIVKLILNCTYSLSPAGTAVGAGAASGTVRITTGSGCPWSSSNDSGFVSLGTTSGTGSVTVPFSVAANNGASRSATLVIGGQNFTVTQSGVGSTSQMRVLRNGLWYVDLNGNHAWDGTPADVLFNFGVQDDLPVMGDWDGSGQLKIGIYRAGLWYIDTSGNNGWDGAPPDKILNFGVPGDLPIVGDWDGSGQLKIGVYRNGLWYVDLNGNNAWDGVSPDAIFNFGVAGDIPVVGDWDGSGHLKIGVFRNGLWYVDLNGNNAWDGVSPDAIFNFGVAGDIPVVGDWDGSGRLKIGVYRDGLWYVDWNGNNQWDGTGPGGDKIFNFGVAGDRPVVAR